eukprot:5893917-Amphidinium_carterae.1
MVRRDVHSNQLTAIQQGIFLRQELRQAPQRTEVQEYETQTNAYEAARYYAAHFNLNQNARKYHEQIGGLFLSLDLKQRLVADTES